jgi:hypothetical protein
LPNVRGISLLDILPWSSNAAGFVPDAWIERLGILTVVDHVATTSGDYHLHEGRLQSIGDALDWQSGNWPVRISGLTRGLPFRLAVRRAPGAAGAQEQAPGSWTLDIRAVDLDVLVPGLVPALQAGGTGATPLHLVPAPAAPGVPTDVRVSARGVVRITGAPGQAPMVQLADDPDPLDPEVPTGATLRVATLPPDVLIGGSGFGLTIGDITADLSSTYTPDEVRARGQDEGWQGIAFREFTIYTPKGMLGVDHLSIGARDLLVALPGSPNGGLQGEVRVEFGDDVADALDVRVELEAQQDDGAIAKLPLPAGTSLTPAVPLTPTAGGRPRRVRAIFKTGLLSGNATLAVQGVRWRLPDGTPGTSLETPWFDAPPESALRYQLWVAKDGPPPKPEDVVQLAEVTVRFPSATPQPGAGAAPPPIDLTVDGVACPNVVYLRGTPADLAGLTLVARGGTSGRWQLGTGSAPVVVPAASSLALPKLPPDVGVTDVTFSTDGGVRRVRVEAVAAGPLLVGHASAADAAKAQVSAFRAGEAPGAPAHPVPTSIIGTFEAAGFHARGTRRPVVPGAAPVLAGGAATDAVQVPAGALAEVEVVAPAHAGSPVPTVSVGAKPVPPAVQLFFAFDGVTVEKVAHPAPITPTPDDGAANVEATTGHRDIALPIAVGAAQRRDASFPTLGAGSATQRLATWRQQLQAQLGVPNGDGYRYYVVARTDDICDKATLQGNRHYNERAATDDDPGGLAARRLKAAIAELVAAGVPSGRIAGRIETADAPADWPAGTLPARFTTKERLSLWQYTPAAAGAAPVWNPAWSPDGAGTTQHNQAKADDRRTGYRCAEVYALPLDPNAVVPPSPAPPAVDADHPAGPVRVLLPGPDGVAPPPPVPSPVAQAGTDWRVRTRLKWDSPSYETLADAVPTEAEVLVAWRKAAFDIPGENAPITPTGPDHWEALLRWAYDVRTGRTDLAGSLAFPEGTLTVKSDVLATALALGPAAAALVDENGLVQSPGWQAATFLALLGAGALVGTQINSDKANPGRVELDRVAFSYQWNGNTEVAATVDYTVDLHVQLDLQGLAKLQGAVRIRYGGVGVRFESDPAVDAPSLARVALSYDDVKLEVVDAGTWELGGALGKLLRVGGMRVGSGSAWLELDLDIAADLGVVTLDTATVRLSLSEDGIKPELRGLTARVNLEEVVTGMGAISVGDGGALDALLGLQVHPVKLGAYGALSMRGEFVSVEIGVQLPVGIPLGATGMGAFGFVGRFVANGRRLLPPATPTTDLAMRELAWYSTLPTQKYAPSAGQYAVGVGAIVGTLPDGGFTFNAEGSLTVGFPDVSVVFGISAKLAAERKLAAMEQGDATEMQSASLLGVVAVEEKYVALAVRASYTVPSVLKLDVPISAYFPLQESGETWYVRIGSDGYVAPAGSLASASRPGEPVSIVVFPGRLDLRAWAFLMIEEGGIQGLGGKLVPLDLGDPLDFEGFALGFGAGFTVAKKAGPISVSLSAFLLVGMGTKPLLVAGAIGGRGELDLVVVSVSLEGFLKAMVTADAWMLEGKVCGRVDLWFFEVEGCVDFRVGSPAADPPAPSPLRGLDLVDHLGAVKGSVAPGAATPVVWPDTIAVLKFAHYVEDTSEAQASFARKIKSSAPASPWSGSTELKYAYRLTGLTLERQDPATKAWTKVNGPMDSAWWLPTHRRAIITGEDAQGPSTEEGRELGLFHWNGWPWARWLGEGAEGLPADPSKTVGEVCTPSPMPVASCACGEDATLVADALARFAADPKPKAAFPSRFRVRARLGAGLTPGRLAALAGEAGWTYAPPGVRPLAAAATVGGKPVTKGWRLPALRQGAQFVATAPTTLRYSKPMHAGELTFECCPGPVFTPRPAATVCDAMPAGTGRVAKFAGDSGTIYSGPALDFATVGNEHVIAVGPGGMRGDLPRLATRVTVDVQPRGGAARVQALGPGNAIVAQAVTSGTARQVVAVEASNVRAVRVEGVGGTPHVFRVCHTPAPSHPLGRLLDDAAPDQPRVTVYDAVGQSVVLAPVPPLPLSPLGVSGACGRVTFKLPPVPPKGQGGPGAGGWVRAEVAGWRRGPITFVSACGITTEAMDAHAQDQGVRTSIVELLDDLADHLDPDSPKSEQPTHAVYLDRATTYRITADWAWKKWKPAQAGDQPGAPDSAPGAWQNGASEQFVFRTAEFGLTPPTPANAPVDATFLSDPTRGGPGFDERTFDPRGVARFLAATTPEADGAPHFLDDELGYWFAADHMEPLVNKYDRTLKVRVLHTRPAPGALHGVGPTPPAGVHTLDVSLGSGFTLTSDVWSDADQRVRDAAAAAPCLSRPPALGSSKLTVTAQLAPATEYDLVLSVVPSDPAKASPPEVVVARTHFRTSRFRDAAGLVAGLGFAPGALQPPVDGIAVAPLGAAPQGGPVVGDGALDDALATLGLDPWPLPAGPRTTAVWLPPAASPASPAEAQWRLVGVLLEADEPIHRAGFSTGAKGEDAPKPRVAVQSLNVHPVSGAGEPSAGPIVALTQRVRNASGTRVLFHAPGSPIALPDTQRYALRLVLEEHGSRAPKASCRCTTVHSSSSRRANEPRRLPAPAGRLGDRRRRRLAPAPRRPRARAPLAGARAARHPRSSSGAPRSRPRRSTSSRRAPT